MPDIDNYGVLILTGLLFSLLGDIFLMLPQNRFIQGLISFMVAHLFFLIGFISIAGIHFTYTLFLPYLTAGSLCYIFLYPGLKRYRIPVLLYLSVILTMSWQAFECYQMIREFRILLALIGTFFFIVSDFMIALNKFRYPFKTSQILILSTYYLSLALIASSV